jgi:phasin family protein
LLQCNIRLETIKKADYVALHHEDGQRNGVSMSAKPTQRSKKTAPEGVVASPVTAVATPTPTQAPKPEAAPATPAAAAKAEIRKPMAAKFIAPKPVAAKPKAAQPAAKMPALKKPAPKKPAVAAKFVAPAAPTAKVLNFVLPTPFKKEFPMATAFDTTPEKITETVKATVAQLNTGAEAAMNSGKAAMEQITAKSKEAVEQSMKSLDEMTDMARGNVEALIVSAKAAAAGVEAIAAHVTEVSKKSFEDASAVAKAMTSAKTPNELMQLQSDFAKAQFDGAVSEFSKLTEMMVKLGGEIMEPVQNRVAIATDKMKSTLTK